MKIEVIGTGCPTCEKLYKLTKEAANELNINDSVEYIKGNEGMTRLIELGSMVSPVLCINNKIVMSGFVNNKDRIKELIKKSI